MSAAFDTDDIVIAVDKLLTEARESGEKLGAINWGDLKVMDIEVRRSLLYPDDSETIVVMIEEASPDCGLPAWLYDRLKDRFLGVHYECEW